MKEGYYTKQRRRKPVHRKPSWNRKRPLKKRVLRQGVELRSFKDFITETSRYRHTDGEYTLVHRKTEQFPNEYDTENNSGTIVHEFDLHKNGNYLGKIESSSDGDVYAHKSKVGYQQLPVKSSRSVKLFHDVYDDSRHEKEHHAAYAMEAVKSNEDLLTKHFGIK